MLGFITDENLREADEEFPGIASFFDALPVKPRTFLDLVAEFEHWRDVRSEKCAGARSPRTSRCRREPARPSRGRSPAHS